MANEEVVVDWEALPAPQDGRSSGSQMFLKLLAVVLLIAFSCHLLFATISSWKTESEKESLSLKKKDASFIWVWPKSLGVDERNSVKEGNDLFIGEWISNPSGPAYTNATCNFIESYQDCLTNGRPDTDYLYWRWQPKSSALPPFNAEKFLKAMQGKSWAFIGDSMFRNQIESLLCLLTKVEEPVLVYASNDFRTRTWHYSSYNFTVALIWAPFLVQYENSDKSNAGSTIYQIHLDILDSNWTTEYHNHDYILISGGQWYYKSTVMLENNQIIGCHNCLDENIVEIGVGVPYRKVLQLLYQFIASSDHKPTVIFRTWTPDHFEYGEWFSGGICNRTRPFKEGEVNGDPTDHAMRMIEVEEFEKAAAVGAKNGLHMELLDTYHLSLLRPDGHPGPYRTFHPFDKDKEAKVQNDCLHWCLPGPIDTWNELLMKIVVPDTDIWHASS